jgi:signal peptidase II
MPSLPVLKQRWLVPGMIAGLLLLLDQLSKRWVVQELGPTPGSRQIFLVGDWFSLMYVQNTGIAFGFFKGMSSVFMVVALLVAAGIIYAYLCYLPNRSLWVQVSTGLILGGALGNVVDRLLLQHVVDFIQVGWWPTFNLADSGISVGVVLLACYLLLTPDLDEVPALPRDDALLSELLSHEVGSRKSGPQ